MSHPTQEALRVVIDAFGETPPDAMANHLRLEAQPPPAADVLGPTDALVKVRSVAVGWVDLLMSSGQYQHMASPPYTPGLEYAGEVAAVGAEVSRLSVGDEVLADGFATGPRSKGPYQRWGGFAGWAVAPASALMALPTGFTLDQGCNLLGNYETAYHCLVARGKLKAGETVLIHGASGSTGLAAVHLARILGATVIATGRSASKLEVVRQQGAHHVICTADASSGMRSFKDDVKALTGGKGVDVVYDGVGGPISAESMRCVRFGARFLIVGWAATPFVAKGRGGRGAPGVNVLPTNLMMMKGLDVLGCPTVISTHRDPSIRVERLARLLEWSEAGQLKPHVARTWPMDQVLEAMEAKWTSKHVGGCVLRPWERSAEKG